MRETCETCATPLGPTDTAFVCSFECTYCPACAVRASMRCGTCGGRLVLRPTRSEAGVPEPDTAANRGYVDAMTYSAGLGIGVSVATPELVTGILEWRDDRCTTGGALHGGALMGLADSLGAILAFLNLPDGAVTTTVSSTTSFFRPVTAGTATGIATPLHVGRRFITVQTEVFDDDARLVSRTQQNQAVLQG